MIKKTVLLGLLCCCLIPLPAFAEDLPDATASEAVAPMTPVEVVEISQPKETPFAVSFVTFQNGRQTAELIIEGKTALSLKGDDGTLVSEMAKKLNIWHQNGALRADRIRPSLRQGRYSVLVDGQPLLPVTRSLAKAEALSPCALTLKVVDSLRTSLGGAPFHLASRGGGHVMASWYGGFFHGRRTANGERYNKWDFTAAHKTLPFGTLLLVTNTRNNKSTIVRVTDRGPYIPGRSIDVSQGAASALGMLRSGVARIRVTILNWDDKLRGR